MVNEWVALKGEEYASEMLIAATTFNVDYFVKMQPQNVQVHVMGHTHRTQLRRITRSDGSRIIYANSGAWVDTAKQTWVDVVYAGPTPATVQIGSYAGGIVTVLGSCALNSNGPCVSTSAGWNLSLGPWSFITLMLSFIHFIWST